MLAKSPGRRARGLGWYVHGNWVAWAGGSTGSMATVLHNRAYDFTVVHLTNVSGNGLGEFMDPLMKPVAGWDTSLVGNVFPCLDDPQTIPSECSSGTTIPYWIENDDDDDIPPPTHVRFFLLQLAACNRPPGNGGEGEDLAAESEEEGVPPDLPCGGADLKDDDLNCGSCGNACHVDWPGTKYAAGGCVDGECGPHWTGLGTHLPPPDTRICDDICALAGIPCVPRGCSGMTAFVCEAYGDLGEQCDLGNPLHEASIEFTGECDEPIPYPENVEFNVFVDFACCCDF